MFEKTFLHVKFVKICLTKGFLGDIITRSVIDNSLPTREDCGTNVHKEV